MICSTGASCDPSGRLARQSRADWVRVLEGESPDGKPVGFPDNTDGDTDQAKLEHFAVILERQFERAYPTASFAGNLERSEGKILRHAPAIVTFIDNNPAFNLDRHRIDQFVADHEGSLSEIEDREAVVAELKSVQRVFRLKPTFAVVDAMLGQGIDSAQQVYFMGQGQFAQAMKAAGLNTIEARSIFRRAEDMYASAVTLFGDLSADMQGISPLAIPAMQLDEATEAKIKALPSLAALFGSLDYCECSSCRSVYSPAAYFVDVMRFLGLRGTQGSGVNTAKSVRDVLLERRPDLGEVELSCENTNTALPYIDLVNEVLEDAVAPPTAITLSAALLPALAEGPVSAAALAQTACPLGCPCGRCLCLCAGCPEPVGRAG